MKVATYSLSASPQDVAGWIIERDRLDTSSWDTFKSQAAKSLAAILLYRMTMLQTFGNDVEWNTLCAGLPKNITPTFEAIGDDGPPRHTIGRIALVTSSCTWDLNTTPFIQAAAADWLAVPEAHQYLLPYISTWVRDS